MNRRRALRTLAAAGTALAVPSWIARAFAQSASPAPTDSAAASASGDVVPAFRAAERAGKPLLVLILPSNEGQFFDRGAAFGELINYASPEQLALLAMCDVVCAHTAEVRAVVHGDIDGDSLMVLVESDGSGEFHAMHGTLPVVSGRRRGEDFSIVAREEDRVIDQRIEFLADMLENALVPDDETLERRARQASAHIAPSELRSITADLAAGRPPAVDAADRAAAIVMLAARRSQRPRAALIERVSAAAIRRLREHRVPGSRWAHASGCGTTIEGEENNIAVGCGMGHVPARSARFLYFFASR